MKFIYLIIIFILLISCTDDAGNDTEKEKTVSTSATIYVLMDTLVNSGLHADSGKCEISSNVLNQTYLINIKQDSSFVKIDSIDAGVYSLNIQIFENKVLIAHSTKSIEITHDQQNKFVITPTLAVDTAKSSNNLLDNFDGTGDLIGYVVNNKSALPDVGRVNGRYRANLIDNSGDKTLHYHNSQGRLDAKLVTFPFEVIARNIGIGMQANSQTSPLPTNNPYIFAGVQVHVPDLDSRNSTHVVVGHRGGTHYTVEGKNTVDGNSSVNDDGFNIVPDGRADIRIVGNANRTLTVYWQKPNLTDSPDSWNPYRNSGVLPGTEPTYGDSVYVGIITYAAGNTGVPFVGTCDSFNIYKD